MYGACRHASTPIKLSTNPATLFDGAPQDDETMDGLSVNPAQRQKWERLGYIHDIYEGESVSAGTYILLYR